MTKTAKKVYTALGVLLFISMAAAIFYGTSYLIKLEFGQYLGKDNVLPYLFAGMVWSILIPVAIFGYGVYAVLTNKPLPTGSNNKGSMEYVPD